MIRSIGKRVLRPVVTRADELLEERGEHPLPAGVTPHKPRAYLASILVAMGRDPAFVMQQLGHTDPGFTLRVYSHATRSSNDEGGRLKALVEGREWAPTGSRATEPAASELLDSAPVQSQTS